MVLLFVDDDVILHLRLMFFRHCQNGNGTRWLKFWTEDLRTAWFKQPAALSPKKPQTPSPKPETLSPKT